MSTMLQALCGTNCFGQLVLDGGLARAREVAARSPRVLAVLRRTRHGEELAILAEHVALETESIGNGEHVLRGAVDDEGGWAILQTISRAWADAGIVHKLERYTEQGALVETYGHAWPALTE